MPKIRLPKSRLTGEQAETPDVTDFSALGALDLPAGLIALLSKGKVLENLLNHIEDLKGTPFEAGMEALAEKSPWVAGHIGRISTALGGSHSNLGHFLTNRTQSAVGNLKDIPIGDVALNPSAAGKYFMSDPAETLGHEATHAAQALFKGAPRFNAEYAAYQARPFGYLRNPYEHGAKKGGRNLKKLVKLREGK